MITLNHFYVFPSVRSWAITLIAVVVSVAAGQSSLLAQEPYYGSATTGIETSSTWSWWPSRHFRADGFPKYGRGFMSSTRDHQTRIPAIPPISGPSYGFYQPCWRQMPMIRRCVSCETMQSNREVPSLNGPPSPTPATTPIPPAPGKSSLEPGDSEPEPETESEPAPRDEAEDK